MRVLFVLLASGCVAAELPQSWWRVVDPDAQAIVGVNWTKVSQSPYAAPLCSSFGEGWTDIRGLEFVEKLDRFVVSATGGKDGGPTSLLLMVEGKLNLAGLRKAAAQKGASLQRYRGVEMVFAPGFGDGTDMAILGEDKVIVGDRRGLIAAVDRLQSQPVAAASTLSRARAFAATSDIWVAGSADVFSAGGLETLRKQLRALGNEDPLALQLAKALKAVEAGHPLELAFRIEITPPIEKPKPFADAPVLAASTRISGVAAPVMGSRTPVSQPPPVETAIEAPPLTAAPLALTAANAPVPSPATTAPPPEKKKIRIFGLDEGTREIEFKD